MPIFDVLTCFMQEQIAAMKVKKNPGKSGNFWLGAVCSYRHETPTEFEQLGTVAEIFLKNLD